MRTGGSTLTSTVRTDALRIVGRCTVLLSSFAIWSGWVSIVSTLFKEHVSCENQSVNFLRAEGVL